MSRVVIFANGEMGDVEQARRLVEADAVVIAADGGLSHSLAAGFNPDVIVGDMDSAPNELLQLAERRGSLILRHPTRKDQTDLELALDIAEQRGATEIIVLGGLGGRLDHALANILLMAREHGPLIRMLDAGYQLAIVRDSFSVEGEPGDNVTLLALSDVVEGVRTRGLEYALEGGTIARSSSLGVSNVLIATNATISVERGLLLAIHVRREDEPPRDGGAELQ